MRINLALKNQGVHMFDDPVFFQVFLSANKQVLYGYKIRCPKITVFKKKTCPAKAASPIQSQGPNPCPARAATHIQF